MDDNEWLELRNVWCWNVFGHWMDALWLPFTPEKIITFALALALRRWIFPKDKKTEEQLQALKSDDSDDKDEIEKS